MSMAVAPKAEATPAWAGTTMRGMFMARAIWQACMGPAPPKLASTKSRGSRPRSVSTSLIACAMFSQVIEMIASAASSRSMPSRSAILLTARSAASASSASLPPNVASSRPRTKFASVTVASSPPRS